MAVPRTGSGIAHRRSWPASAVQLGGGVGDRCRQQAGPILDHVSSANSARDLELLRRAVGDSPPTFHGISYGTQLGAIYANLFPGRVRAMVLDGSIDFVGNVTGHGSKGAEIPLNTRQDIPTGTAAAFAEFLRDCAAAGPRCAFSDGDPRPNGRRWSLAGRRSRSTNMSGPIRNWSSRPWPIPPAIRSWPSCCRSSSTTGTADVALLEDVTGSSPPPIDVGAGPYLGNREEAYSAIQCSDSTVPTDPRRTGGQR